MKSVYTLHYIPPETSVHNFAPIQKHLQEEVGMTASRTSSRKFFLALRKAPAWLQLGFALSLAGMAYRSALYKLSSKLMRWGSNHIILNIFWPGLNMTMFMLFGFDWMFDKILTQVSKWVDLMSSLKVYLQRNNSLLIRFPLLNFLVFSALHRSCDWFRARQFTTFGESLRFQQRPAFISSPWKTWTDSCQEKT